MKGVQINILLCMIAFNSRDQPEKQWCPPFMHMLDTDYAKN